MLQIPDESLPEDNPFAITIVLSLFTFIRGVGNLTSGQYTKSHYRQKSMS